MHAALSWQEITQLDDLMGLERQWEQLASSCQASLFSQFKWIKHWLKVYWQDDWQLHVYVGFHKEQLVALAPFYLQQTKRRVNLKTLCLLGQGEDEKSELASEYLDVLIAPQYQFQALRCLSQYLHRLDFDYLECRAIYVSSLLYQLLAKEKRSYCGDAKSYAVNCDDWSVARLSRNARSQWRRASKTLQDASAEFRWLNMDEIEQYWPDLVRMHQQRWQNKGQFGAFFAADFIQFHATFRHENAKHVAMSGLFIGQQAVALNYYLVERNYLHFYQSGWDERCFAHCSPGFSLHVWSILHSKAMIYDFMMGGQQASYKARFAAYEKPMVNLYLVKHPWRVRLSKLINKIV